MIKDRLFLKKVFDSYVLHRIKDGILTIEGDSHYTIGGIEPFYKLSISKCRAIEFGYDLNELAKEYMKISSIEFDAFKSGFQKAIEILGDKKFSKEDVRKTFVDAFQKCYEVISSGKFDDIASSIEWLTQTNADNYIQSLQQAEWDVDIVTTTIMENGKSGLDVPIVKPKLDTDGCLILKRI